MKTFALPLLTLLLFGAAGCVGNKDRSSVPVTNVTTPAPSGEPIVYEQRPAPGRAALVTPEQAGQLLDRFRTAYPKMGSPRMLIYVNRALVDEQSGLKLAGRAERTTTVREQNQAGDQTSENTRERERAENRYRREEPPPSTLADQQTVRDVERLFGRPLRAAGVTLADQRVATSMLESRPFTSLRLEGEQARKDREALSRIADVVLEVLISSREVQVEELSGTRTYETPDIQATAIRLSDAKIMGQAAASDIIGRQNIAGARAAQFDVREISEATALALMEDMLTGVE